MNRRQWLQACMGAPLGCAAPKAVVSSPSLAAPSSRKPAPSKAAKLRVLCIGAHPDDPESACGGTLARYAEAGHDVHVLYMTRGELGIDGKTPTETATIRSAEAERGCAALGATPHFFGKPADTLVFTPPVLDELQRVTDAINADVWFGHWPLDTDYDHQASAMLTLNVYLRKERRHPLYMFEVESGTQTLAFPPHVYVEIGPVLRKKLAAIRAHESQDAERRLYERHHEPMERFRAREVAGTAAEAFAVLAPLEEAQKLPGL